MQPVKFIMAMILQCVLSYLMQQCISCILTTMKSLEKYLLNCNLPAEIRKNNQVQRLVSELTSSGLGEMMNSTDEAFV